MGEDRRGSASDIQTVAEFDLGRGGRGSAASAAGSRPPPPERFDQER